MLFGRRVAFSGTPSELMPVELGACQYEEGTDGEVLAVLSDPDIVASEQVGSDWTPESLLHTVAASGGEISALIDTGALVTGLSNEEVASFLLRTGLNSHEGVVFLDDADR